MTASARVFTQLDLSASDNASSKIKGVRNELRSLNKQAAANGDTTHRAREALDQFGKAGDRTADTSGKLSTALSSLGDFAGSMEGDMRRASEAAGLLDDVMTVLPGPIGIAAGALTGLAAVLVLNQLESQRTRAAIAEVAPEGMVERIKELADSLDLNAKGAAALAQAFRDSDEPADQLTFQITRIVEQAERVGRDASDDVAKFADSLKKADKRAQILRKRLADLTQAQASANDPRIQAFGFGDPTGAMEFQRKAIENIEAYEQGIKDARAEVKKFRADLIEQGINLGQRADLRDREAELLAKVTDLEAKRENAEKRRRRVVKFAAEEERQIIADRAAEFARLEREASRPRRRRVPRTAKPEQEMGGGAADDAAGFGEPIEFMLAQEARARAELTEQKRKEAQATLELAAAKAEMDRALLSNLTRLQEEARQLDEGQIRQAEAVKDAYFGAAKGLLQAAASTVKSERIRNAALAVSAAGDAAYYTAQAFAARLPQRKIQLFAAAGQAAIAAGIYGGKAVLGGRGGGGGSGGGAGGGSRALTAEGGGREGGGETTINVNFPGFVVGREADVAKQLKSLTAPLAGTGYGA
jgi:hypothetical protein